MRGFLGGLILGLVVVVGGVVAVSLVSPLLLRPDVTAEAPEAAAVATPAGDAAGVDAAGQDSDVVEAAPVGPGAPASGSDDLSKMETADTAPSDKPQVGPATGALERPAEPAAEPGVAVETRAPTAPTAPSGAPEAPSADMGISVTPANPAQPQVPEVADTGSGFGTGASTDEAAPEVAVGTDTAPAGRDSEPVGTPAAETAPAPSTMTAAAPETPAAPQGTAAPESQAAPATATEQDASPETQAPATAETPSPGSAPATDTATAEPPAVPATQQPAEQPAEQVTETMPRIAALPQAGEDGTETRPGIGTQVVPLTERDKPAEQAAVETAAAPANPPLRAFATAFDNPENKPVVSVVLIDDDQSLGVEALADLSFPVSIAIDPAAPGAAEKMAKHRAAGREVLAMIDMPASASPTDAEVSLGVWLGTLPETVAIIEGPGNGVQGNRPLSDQVTAIALSSGRGLILRDNGLNTAQKLAARAGVPSAVVFRDFDGAGQSSSVMRRFLDQAAFRAGQQGAVIMLGRVRPDTISALVLWGLQDRANRVALAPVSAALAAE